MREGFVGQFHSADVVQNAPRALSMWRVTTLDLEIARQVSGLLGGNPLNEGLSGGGVWEVRTHAARVPITVSRLSECSVVFGLAGRDLGKFVYYSAPWTLHEMLRGDGVIALPAANPVPAELSIEAMNFGTRNGRITRHLVPFLTIRDTGDCVPELAG
jgi:hypothetical protein